MNDIINAHFREQERIVQNSYDPSIRFFYNPRIERWIICEDARMTRKDRDPWQERDPDLEGVEGVGEKTPFKALKKMETVDGKPIPPYAPIVIKILQLECPRVCDRSPSSVIWDGVRAREELKRAKRREVAQEFREALIPRLLGRKRFFMS